MSKTHEAQLKEVERKKHEDSVKYLYFSRYLFLRYMVVLFLFTNLFWLFISLGYNCLLGDIVAGSMTIYSGVAAIEQLSKMHNHKLDVPITRIYFWVQIVVNVILLLLTVSPLKLKLFPFLNNKNATFLLIGFLLIGIIICVLCELKIRKINKNIDRYAHVIKTFENAK
ncbi:PTS cellobiose transporter subunit IIA [Lactobacillus sp. ESL0791]|uniref:PTS cellobiose transporter subunit IIA n=1 Tax=Lactobacillus sp. ESL0791 TaxID=2983234 RepID=UPI0023F64E1C|nr:PTS cellobiose transporter subunit IIA [Lactobacillus sp. ESL0791]MDF7638323.1 PTS cellobiose transporter subunit IIA [Lactobacillus sp. ESL0791]